MQFDEFAQWLERVEQASNAHEKARALFDLLQATDPAETACVIHTLQGRFDAGYRRRLGASKGVYRRLRADLMSGAIQSTGSKPDHGLPSVKEVYNTLHDAWQGTSAWLSGEAELPQELASLASRLQHRRMDMLARVLAGPWPDDSLLLQAIASIDSEDATVMPRARPEDLKGLRKLYARTLPDLGLIAAAVREQGLQAVVLANAPRVGVPLPPEQLRVWQSPEEAIQFCGQCLAELKYDGYYVQVHKLHSRIWLFGKGKYNREWVDLAEDLPTVAADCASQVQASDIIAEGELVGYHSDRRTVVPFQETLSAPHHRLYFYDLLWLDGIDHRSKSLRRRSKRLEQIMPAAPHESLAVMPEEPVNSLEDLFRILKKAISSPEHEGVILKRKLATYNSGGLSRGQGKLKNYISLDAVVLGYWGHHRKPTAYLVGVWGDPALGSDGRLVPIAIIDGVKIGGQERREMLHLLRHSYVSEKPPEVFDDTLAEHWVQPEVVVEIVCDGQCQRDARFRTTGYTFRDVTDLRLRHDKSIWHANDLEQFLQLRPAPGEA